MRILLLLPLFLCGCAIEKFNHPPEWGSIVTTHERFFGLNLAVPAGNTTSAFKIQLGWGSHTWSVIPVATNEVHAAKVSDTFRLGQETNPFNTSITEDLVTGWEGAPPPPRLHAP